MAAIVEHLNATIPTKGINVKFRYTDRDPFAVTFEFFRQPNWTFSRDLLVAGLVFAVGEGDVLIRPVSAHVEMTLRSPYGHTEVTFDREPLFNAVQKTLELVPLGAERFNFDVEIAKAGIAGWTPRKGGTR